MAILHEHWSLQSRAHSCAITSKKFTPGESFYTALFFDRENGGYLRKDFCIDAWKDRKKNNSYSKEPFSFWTSIYTPPEKTEKPSVSDESPETLLRRLVEEDATHTENVRYILAVMLERKKILVEVDSQLTSSGILRIYEHKKKGDIFIVKDPNIALSDIESIQQEVSDLLDKNHNQKKANPPK